MTSGLRIALVSFVIAGAASIAGGAEGVLPVRAGDRVEGVLSRCGDRHLLRYDLTAGETFKMRVRGTSSLNDDVVVRVYDPTGLQIGARIRAQGSTVKVGPFPVRETGAYHVQLSTFTRHGIEYEATSKVRRRVRRKINLPDGHSRAFTAAAGSTLRVRRARGDISAQMFTANGSSIEIAADSACLAAITGDGLTLPQGGQHQITLLGGRARLIVSPPARGRGTTVTFPALPVDSTSVSSWYVDSGWVRDATRTAPADHEPPVAAPPQRDDPPYTYERVSLIDAPTAPSAVTASSSLVNDTSSTAIELGIGLPIAPMPVVEEVIARGTVEPFGDGPSYVYDLDVADLGTVSYRVQFVVGGQTSLAPIALDGSLTMRWSVEGGGALHRGDWSLTFDPRRNVQVLEGSESRTDASFRTVHSVAQAFVLPSDGVMPAGALSWTADVPGAEPVRRVETYDGLGGRNVTILQ